MLEMWVVAVCLFRCWPPAIGPRHLSKRMHCHRGGRDQIGPCSSGDLGRVICFSAAPTLFIIYSCGPSQPCLEFASGFSKGASPSAWQRSPRISGAVRKFGIVLRGLDGSLSCGGKAATELLRGSNRGCKDCEGEVDIRARSTSDSGQHTMATKIFQA